MNRLKLDETALDLFARRPTRGFFTGLSFIDVATTNRDGDEVGYRPRQVVEICGASDTPKVQVLEHVVASFLAKSCKSSDQAPKERVFIFDHEGEVSAMRLMKLVASRLAGSKREDAVEEALNRVQTCCCRDSFQWLATLNHIHFQLLKAATIPTMLVFNCVGSFQAIDKMTAKSVGDGLALSEQVFIFLKQFIRHHSPIIFATKETIKSTRNPWDHAEYLPSSWTSQVSKRIFLRMLHHHDRHLIEKEDDSQLEGRDGCTQFEAKCIVSGESRVFRCCFDGDLITTNFLGEKKCPRMG